MKRKQIFLSLDAGASGDMLLGAFLDLHLNKTDPLKGVKQSWTFGERIIHSDLVQDLVPSLADWHSLVAPFLQLEEQGRYQLKQVKRGKHEALKIDFFVGSIPADDFRSPSHSAAHAGNEIHSHVHPGLHTHLKQEHGNEEHQHLHHEHFLYVDLRTRIEKTAAMSEFPAAALKLALQVLRILADGEAEAHQVPIDGVYFHEVGSFDSLMDVVAFSAIYYLLGFPKVIATPPMAGTGQVQTSHGLLPVPPPAVKSIISKFGIPIREGGPNGEWLTPTGAAILAAVVEEWKSPEIPPELQTQGVGAGNRNPMHFPNVVVASFL